MMIMGMSPILFGLVLGAVLVVMGFVVERGSAAPGSLADMVAASLAWTGTMVLALCLLALVCAAMLEVLP